MSESSLEQISPKIYTPRFKTQALKLASTKDRPNQKTKSQTAKALEEAG